MHRRFVELRHFVVEVAVDDDDRGAVGAGLNNFRRRRSRRHHHHALNARGGGISRDGSGCISRRHHRRGFESQLTRDRKADTVAPVLERTRRQRRIVLEMKICNTQFFAEPGGMNQRRIALAQRDDGMAICHGEKIKPAPDRRIPAVAHALEIRARQMIDFNPYFKNAAAGRALKNSLRLGLVTAFRATQLVKQSHGSAQSLAYFSRSSQHSTIPSLQHSNSIKSFAVRPHSKLSPTPLPGLPLRNRPLELRPASRYRS